MYAAGPLTVLGGVMQNRYDDEAYVVGAGYNFGVADLKVAYHNVEGGSAANPNNKYTALQFGLNVPMGATTFSAGYIRSETQAVAGGVKVKSNKLGLGASYALSKRTSFIATYGKAKNTKANFDFSVRHTF